MKLIFKSKSFLYHFKFKWKGKHLLSLRRHFVLRSSPLISFTCQKRRNPQDQRKRPTDLSKASITDSENCSTQRKLFNTRHQPQCTIPKLIQVSLNNLCSFYPFLTKHRQSVFRPIFFKIRKRKTGFKACFLAMREAEKRPGRTRIARGRINQKIERNSIEDHRWVLMDNIGEKRRRGSYRKLRIVKNLKEKKKYRSESWSLKRILRTSKTLSSVSNS